jgi:very-short-patch-repair endonuclease
MAEKRSSASEPRVWALTDRSITPPNRIRAHTMRLSPTEAEQKLWWHLRHRLPLSATHFRRQARQHATRIERDAKRTEFLKAEGYGVLRFWNNDVLTNIEGVLEVILSSILATPTPTPPHKGEGKERRP